MTKQELSKMLHATGCPVNEGISDLDNGKKFPRIDYWEIACGMGQVLRTDA